MSTVAQFNLQPLGRLRPFKVRMITSFSALYISWTDASRQIKKIWRVKSPADPPEKCQVHRSTKRALEVLYTQNTGVRVYLGTLVRYNSFQEHLKG